RVAGGLAALEGPGLARRLARPPDCGESGLWTRRRPPLAAPLRAGGVGWVGGRATQWTATQGPPGWADRRRPGEPIASLLGACADLLECGLAHGFPGQTLSPEAVGHQCSPLVAPAGLALAPTSPGAGPPAGSRGTAEAGRLGGGAPRGRPGALPPAVSGRIRPPSVAPHPRDVDEGPTGAGTDPGHQPAPRLFRRLGCRERAVVVCPSGAQVGGAFCRLSPAFGGGLPHRPAR